MNRHTARSTHVPCNSQGVVLGAWLAAVLLVAPQGAQAQEVLIDADARTFPPDVEGRKVHGEVSLGLRAGLYAEDPVFELDPTFSLDFSDRVPLKLTLGALIRLRIVDRSPEQGTVLRRTDWDEPGDFLTLLRAVSYADSFAHGRGGVDVRAELGRVDNRRLGDGAIIDGYANSLDLDRRRSGVDSSVRIHGPLLGHPAGIDLDLLIGDLTGHQVFAGRVAGDWAGAWLGVTVAGDPLAPRSLAPGVAGEGLAVDRDNAVDVLERRGVASIGLDLGYDITDEWWYSIRPHIDLVLMPGLARGIHLGADAWFSLGKRRQVRLGAIGEFTYGDSNYDPGYFDVYYTQQRVHAQFIDVPAGVPADFATLAAPKAEFVQIQNLAGAGGYGGLRFEHRDGAFAETGYRYRPGALGHTWETRVGIDLPEVRLGLLHAHRGALGFDIIDPRGTLAELELDIPIGSYFSVNSRLGYLYLTRRTAGASADAGAVSSGFVGGGGLVLVGIRGHIGF